MARVTSPLHSASASGQIGKDIVFSHWKQTDYARQYVGTNSSDTTAQQVQRGYFKSAVQAWEAETNTVQTAWDTYVDSKNLNMSGFNLYCKKYIDFLVAHSGTPPSVTTTPPSMS